MSLLNSIFPARRDRARLELEAMELEDRNRHLKHKLAESEAERESFLEQHVKAEHHIKQVLGQALGYPSSLGRPVVTAENTVLDLAKEAAAKLRKLQGDLDLLRKGRQQILAAPRTVATPRPLYVPASALETRPLPYPLWLSLRLFETEREAFTAIRQGGLKRATPTRVYGKHQICWAIVSEGRAVTRGIHS